MQDTLFKQIIWNFYKKNKRAMPWREDISPYSIFISEVMLQQTQVARVLIKYPQFIIRFPDFKSLAQAETPTLLSQWQGMGYNRRALYLRSASQIIIAKYDSLLPDDPVLLDELPGIGYATACSITAFAYNTPVTFIETNIRRVFIHHYFKDKENISDKDLLPLVERTVDKKKAREWYWALMDYGAHLGKIVDNPNKKSQHYVKQKKFVGSVREVRGGILKLLLKKPHSLEELKKIYSDERLFTALEQLVKEGFIDIKRGNNSIKL
ncbi:MAG: A/G-specific adenine glycosylase [Candidatus Roizmanbacteria bacterium]|nr:A/G-specific adenine glycosylase [Candidatus Roizmanbacteria bacterium]